MKIEIKIPAMGESIAEATISNILKPNGSFVKVDEELLELETDKVNQVLYAPKSGKLSLSVSVGQTVKIGDMIGFIDTEALGGKEPSAVAPKPSETPSVQKKDLPPVRILPEQRLKEEKVSERAPEHILRNTQAAKPIPSASMPTPKGATRQKMSRLRKVIAERLVEVKNTTAMLTTFNEIDMSKILEIRSKEKESFLARYGVKLGFMSFFVKATVAALKAYPQVNASIDGEDIVLYNSFDIGVAVSTDKGLMVPVVQACDTLSFGGIEKAIGEFAKKAREGKIGIDDLRGGSFTITNGGTFGSLLSTPILNPPQSAILGMHAIVKRAVVVEDTIVIRPMMYVALSYDHRLIDGKDAVLFLVHLKESLEDPSRLLLDL